MQSFAGAETTRRFSFTSNSTWPMTGRQPKYAGAQCRRVHDELQVRLHDGRLLPVGVARAALGVIIAPPAIADAGATRCRPPGFSSTSPSNRWVNADNSQLQSKGQPLP